MMDAKQLIARISEKDFLMDFFRKHNIAQVEQLQVIDSYVQGNYRAGIIVEATEVNRRGKTKILIDLKLGQPAIEQVHDALYTTGKDCDIKIIVHSNAHNDDDDVPSADEYVVLGLVSRLQEDNIPIVLFHLDGDDLEISYDDVFHNWNLVDRTNPCIIPHREVFWNRTFWAVYFDSFCEGWYRADIAFESGFEYDPEDRYIIFIDRPLDGEIKLIWDENGLRYEIKQRNESYDYLKKSFDVIAPELEKLYGKDNVVFENLNGRLPRLYIKQNDIPFSWLYSAAPSEITKFAGIVYEDAWALRRRIEETVEKICPVPEQ
jgi:hypothetical protein